MRKPALKRIVFIIAVIILLVFAYSFIEPFWIQVKRIDIMHPDIPEEFNGFTIAFMADIHHGPYFSTKRLERLVIKTNALKPDMVLLGGDYVHRDDVRHVYSCFKALGKLTANFGTYAVIGNHDYRMGEELTIQEMDNNRIQLLRNTGVWINKGEEQFFLGGVDDLMEGRPDMQATVKDADERNFVLVVSHNPDVAEGQPLDRVDWILAGHTHGGQVTLFGLWAPIVSSSFGQRYRTGLVQKGNTSIYVTNGIGTITPPVRFFARPQIIYITLNNK